MRVSKPAVAVCALALASLFSFSVRGDVGAALTVLVDAVDARVDAIEASGSIDRAELKEGKTLAKAAVTLRQFTGTLDARGLSALVKGGKLLFKSGTQDPGVLDAAGTVLELLCDLARDNKEEIEKFVAAIASPQAASAIRAVIDKTTAILETAKAMAETDPAGAAKFIVKAIGGYAKTEIKAEKLRAKELARGKHRDCPGPINGILSATMNGDPWTPSASVWAGISYRDGVLAALIFGGETNSAALRFDYDPGSNYQAPFPGPGTYPVRTHADAPTGMRALYLIHDGNIPYIGVSGTVVIEKLDLLTQSLSGTFDVAVRDSPDAQPITFAGRFDFDCVQITYR